MNPKTNAAIVVLAVVLLALPMALKIKRDHARAAAAYHLVSVDGHKLPYAPRRQRQQSPEISSGTLSLYNDGTFHATMGYKDPSGGTMKNEFKGTYAGNGTECTLKWEGAGETTATVEEDKLTMDNEGMIFLYER